MNFTTKTDVDLNLRINIVEGAVDKESLINHLQNIYSSPEFDPKMNVLWDLRNADLRPFSYGQIEEVGDFVGKKLGFQGQSKVALIVSRDVDYGLTHILKMLMEGTSFLKIQTFRNYDEGLAWLQS